MTMYGNLILLVCLSILTSINCQQDNERDLLPERSQADGKSKSLFDDRFNRGQCPQPFYQSGDECLYFSTDDTIYSWQQAEQTCSGRIARMLSQQQTSLMSNQPKITPTKGVRQLILNTPEKVEIFRVLFQEYKRQNFAVRLPSDYNKRKRCPGVEDTEWPQYCGNSERSNSGCLETKSNDINGICLREVNCNEKRSSLACEFTLPGSAEITTSKFTPCLETSYRLNFRWIPIALITSCILVSLLGCLIILVMRKRRSSSYNTAYSPAPRAETTSVTIIREDPAAEPIFIRATPSSASDTARSLERVPPPPRDNPENV